MSEQQKTDDNKFGTGAVRSADADHLDFLSMPLIGLIGMARTASEGGSKYGRFNYMKGMPAHVCVNHAIRHLVMWGMGDRSEPHLSHAMWNCAAAEQSMVLNPELNAQHLPGPGYTLTPEILELLEEQAPKLAEKRKDKEWLKTLGGWVIDGLAEIRTILGQRKAAKGNEWKKVVNSTIRDYVRSWEKGWTDPKFVTLKNDQADEDATGTEHFVFTEETAAYRAAIIANAALRGDPLTFAKPASTPTRSVPQSNARAVDALTPKITEDGLVFPDKLKPTRSDSHAASVPAGLSIYVDGRKGVRYEEAFGAPTPGPGETWAEYEGGHRLYWHKEDPNLEAIKSSRQSTHLSGLAGIDLTLKPDPNFGTYVTK
jgi:hypothetical protein